MERVSLIQHPYPQRTNLYLSTIFRWQAKLRDGRRRGLTEKQKALSWPCCKLKGSLGKVDYEAGGSF